MICFRDNNCWLKHRVISIIKEKHIDLYETPFKRSIKKIKNFILDKDNWWCIGLIILLIYTLSVLISIDWLCFSITLKTTQYIIDQRTTNVAAIISMTLAVVGFLISNLAVKEAYAYKILFKYSKLYPIIYFTLFTIGSLIIISTLRDAITNEYIYSKLVVTGTYLVIIVLFLIGYLFRAIILFTNSKEIQKIFHKELIHEAKENIESNLIIKYSKNVYSDWMTKTLGLNEYDIFEALTFNDEGGQNHRHTNEQTKDNIVKDINLISVAAFVTPKKALGTVYYKALCLNKETKETDDYIWVRGIENSHRNKKQLKRALKLRGIKKQDRQTDKNIVRKYFEQRMEELTVENKYNNLESILSSFLEMYELQMKHNAA